ncbi:MAG: hypothetical protein ACFFA6_10965 [Promethearchaeota archaeon]
MHSFKLKIILVGLSNRDNKDFFQSFFRGFFKKRFALDYKFSIGVDILTKDVEFKPGELATLSVWDISKQNRFNFIHDIFFRGATGAVLIFDLMKEQTYKESRKWLEEIRQITQEEIPFLLIGFKSQVEKMIDINKIREFAEKEKGIFVELASKKSEDLDKAIYDLTRRIIDSRNDKSL